MHIVVKDIEGHRKEIRIEVAWRTIEADYEFILSTYLQGHVPGFRPGRTPREIVERKFRRRILDEVSERCAQRLLQQGLEQKGLSARGPISITELEIKKNRPFRFKAQFAVVPDFDLPAYREFRFSVTNDEQRRDEICRWLLDHTNIAVPDALVEHELSLDSQKDIEKESEAWNAAQERVRLLIILDEIAFQDGIEIDERDMKERIERTAEQHGKTVSSLRQQLLRDGGMSRMRSFLRAEKTLDYLLETCV